MNRILLRVAVAAGLLVAILAGCGGGGDGQSGSGEPVRFWHAMGGPLGRALNGLVDDFNVGRPAPIESVSMGRYQALSQKLMAAVAAGGPPDIGQCYEAWTANLIDNFLECVRSRKQPLCDLETGHRSNSFSLLANIAEDAGTHIEWDPEKERVINNEAANDLLHYEYRRPWTLG